MTKTKFTKLLSLILCMVLSAAITLFTFGCSDDTDNGNKETTAPSTENAGAAGDEDVTVLGEGEKSFAFVVTDGNGKDTAFTVNTDKSTVGEALMELGLIEGDEGDYGLYVKTVNGITVDYDKDGKYWAFYIDGDYAMTGVDKTDITEGAIYAFKVE